MPSVGAGAQAARNATMAANNRSGRASTILTTKKRKRTASTGDNFDTYGAEA